MCNRYQSNDPTLGSTYHHITTVLGSLPAHNIHRLFRTFSEGVYGNKGKYGELDAYNVRI